MYIGGEAYELVHGKYTLTIDEIQDLVLDIQDQGIINTEKDYGSVLKIRRLEEKVEKQKAEIKGYKAELKKLKPKKGEVK